MLRWLFLMAALLGLAGCDLPTPGEALDTLGLNSRNAEPPPVDGPVNAHCRDVAQQRMRDGAYNGLDEETQQAIYSGTYSDCVKYESSHGPG